MRRIVELELCSKPRVPRELLDGHEVAERCRADTGLSHEVVLGLSLVPEELDVQNLQASLGSGEQALDEFNSFCAQRGLQPDLTSELSAAEFLAYVEGQALAWLHLPEEDEGLNMARALVAWAADNGMDIHDGASTYERLSEDQIYALWKGREV